MLCFLGYTQTDIPNNTPLEIGAVTNPDENNNTSQGTALNIPSIIDKKPDVNLRDSLTRMPIKMLSDNKMLQAGHDLKLDPKVGRSEKKGAPKKNLVTNILVISKAMGSLWE